MQDECNPDLKVLRTELKSLRLLVETVRQADLKALELQAREYERRLEELNHAHTKASVKDATFVTRDLHDREFARVDKEAALLARIVWVGVGILMIGEAVLWAMLSHLIRTP